MNEHTRHPPDRRYDTGLDRLKINAMFHEISRNSQMAVTYAQSAFRPRFPRNGDEPKSLGEAIGQAIEEMINEGPRKKRDAREMTHLDICPGCFESARIAMQDALTAMNDAKRYLDSLKSEEVQPRKEED